MTFCCWPSAVIIPAGSGFADEKRNVSFIENNLEVSNMQWTTFSLSLLAKYKIILCIAVAKKR